MGIYSDWAAKYFSSGLNVIPCIGKNPIIEDWSRYCKIDIEDDTLDSWEKKHPNHNIGMPLGPQSGIVAFDLDYLFELVWSEKSKITKEQFDKIKSQVESEHEQIKKEIIAMLPPSPCVKIGKDGKWCYFYRPKGEFQTISVDRYGIRLFDILWDGRQTILPPSIHPDTGRPYRWINGDLTKHYEDLPELEWSLVQEIRQRYEKKLDFGGGQKQITGRNDLLKNSIFGMFKRGLTPENCVAHLLEIDREKNAESLFADREEYPKTYKTPDKSALAFAKSNYKSFKDRLNTEPPGSFQPKLERKSITGILPDQNPGKKPLGTKANLEEILNRIGAICRYNVISKKQEIKIPGREYSVDNYDNAIIADIIDICSRLQMPTDKINAYLLGLCDKYQFNPVKTWIESKPWDGTSRLKDFYETITARNEYDPRAVELKEILMLRWVVSAIAAAYSPSGFSAHGILVLQADQNLGKTYWFKKLVPAELGLIGDGKTLKTDDKDSILSIIQLWLVELGELDATFRKSDIAQLKSFITRDRDNLRLPYAMRSADYPRRTVFFGSVNDPEFLADPTGNRRFWTIGCEKINYQHNIDMQQFWAEVATLHSKGESPYLSNDEMALLNESNKMFEIKSPVEEKLQSFYDWEQKVYTRQMRATEVLEEMGFKQVTQADKNHASRAILKFNGGKIHKTKYGNLYDMPRKVGF